VEVQNADSIETVRQAQGLIFLPCLGRVEQDAAEEKEEGAEGGRHHAGLWHGDQLRRSGEARKLAYDDGGMTPFGGLPQGLVRREVPVEQGRGGQRGKGVPCQRVSLRQRGRI